MVIQQTDFQAIPHESSGFQKDGRSTGAARGERVRALASHARM